LSATLHLEHVYLKSVLKNLKGLFSKINIFEVKLDMIAKAPTQLEQYFQQFRDNIIGIDQFESYGHKQIIYTDWTASGRLYRPIEEKLMNQFGPVAQRNRFRVQNKAIIRRHIIKHHVHASADDDVLITDGTGMTGVVNKFQRIF
jgi:selenocysteine lyase/cysteine desulfurase